MVPAWSGLGEGQKSPPLVDGHFSLCFHMVERDHLSYKGTNFINEVQLSWPVYLPTHLQITSHWGLGFQHKIGVEGEGTPQIFILWHHRDSKHTSGILDLSGRNVKVKVGGIKDVYQVPDNQLDDAIQWGGKKGKANLDRGWGGGWGE